MDLISTQPIDTCNGLLIQMIQYNEWNDTDLYLNARLFSTQIFLLNKYFFPIFFGRAEKTHNGLD